jgi:hypothetical protein
MTITAITTATTATTATIVVETMRARLAGALALRLAGISL